jgi:G:T-mismatch repair DNA endonuclease (very short patch repair protein)
LRGCGIGTVELLTLLSEVILKHAPCRCVPTPIRKVHTQAHLRDIPGCPDFAFREKKVLIFVDGDFWHGWHFSAWRHKLTEKWENKIAHNRLRDRRNRAKLRREGWTVLGIWEHQIERDLAACLSRIKRLLHPGRTAQALNAKPDRTGESFDRAGATAA